MLTKKRCFDLISSGLLLILILPIWILTYPLLVFLIGKPIIFKQNRIGKNGKKFVMYKLRSMKKDAQANKKKYLQKNEAPFPMFKMSNDPRFITKKISLPFVKGVFSIEVGKFLSTSGIDEIPQFLNILKGQMSLIGPRPLPLEEAAQLKKIDMDWYKWRHSVKPGIFSMWAADPVHNISLSYWKKLEKATLDISAKEQILIIAEILVKQVKNIFTVKK